MPDFLLPLSHQSPSYLWDETPFSISEDFLLFSMTSDYFFPLWYQTPSLIFDTRLPPSYRTPHSLLPLWCPTLWCQTPLFLPHWCQTLFFLHGARLTLPCVWDFLLPQCEMTSIHCDVKLFHTSFSHDATTPPSSMMSDSLWPLWETHYFIYYFRFPSFPRTPDSLATKPAYSK